MLTVYGILLVLHLIGATIWTGGHLTLLAAVLPRALAERNAKLLLDFESRFERIGVPALLIQVITGFWLASIRLGSLGGIFTLNPVAHLVQIKLLLLVATAALAVHARLVLIPKLTDAGLPTLAWHIIPVSLLSVLFVVVGVAFRFGGF